MSSLSASPPMHVGQEDPRVRRSLADIGDAPARPVVGLHNAIRVHEVQQPGTVPTEGQQWCPVVPDPLRVGGVLGQLGLDGDSRPIRVLDNHIVSMASRGDKEPTPLRLLVLRASCALSYPSVR